MQPARNTLKGDRKKVLVVDENFTFRYFLCKALRANGYDYIEEEDYNWVLFSEVKKNTFDVVVIDYKTLMKSRMDFSSSFSNPCPIAENPIIFLTGPITKEIKQIAQQFGVRAVIERRSDLSELLDKINHIVHEKMGSTASALSEYQAGFVG